MLIENFTTELKLDNNKINEITEFFESNSREQIREKDKFRSRCYIGLKIFAFIIMAVFFVLYQTLYNNQDNRASSLGLCVILSFLCILLFSYKQNKGTKEINTIFDYDKYLYMCDEIKTIEVKRLEVNNESFIVSYKTPYSEYLKTETIYDKNLIHCKDDISVPVVILDICQDKANTINPYFIRFSVILPLSIM